MESLSLSPNDPKALFRQVQAEEAMEKIEDAAQNMARLIQMDPKNKTFQQTMERLRERVYEKAKEQRDMNKQVRAVWMGFFYLLFRLFRKCLFVFRCVLASLY